jgi:hypothetical protein
MDTEPHHFLMDAAVEINEEVSSLLSVAGLIPISSLSSLPVAAPAPTGHTVMVSNAVTNSHIVFGALLWACPSVARFSLEQVGALTPTGPLCQPYSPTVAIKALRQGLDAAFANLLAVLGSGLWSELQRYCRFYKEHVAHLAAHENEMNWNSPTLQHST